MLNLHKIIFSYECYKFSRDLTYAGNWNFNTWECN